MKAKTTSPCRTTTRGKALDHIHVARQALAVNRKTGSDDPGIITRSGRSGKSRRSHRVGIKDSQGNVVAYVEQDSKHPLSCGAVVYIVCKYGSEILPQNTVGQY